MLLGLSFSSRAFLLGTLVLPSLQMPTFPISNLIQNGRWKTSMWMCYLFNHVLMINWFIYSFVHKFLHGNRGHSRTRFFPWAYWINFLHSLAKAKKLSSFYFLQQASLWIINCWLSLYIQVYIQEIEGYNCHSLNYFIFSVFLDSSWKLQKSSNKVHK